MRNNWDRIIKRWDPDTKRRGSESEERFKQLLSEMAARTEREKRESDPNVERMCGAKGNAPYLPGPGNRFCTTELNCDACHLKMPWKVAQVFQDHPQRAARRLERERRAGKTFRPRGPSIEQLVQLSKRQIVRGDDDLEIKCTGCTD